VVESAPLLHQKSRCNCGRECPRNKSYPWSEDITRREGWTIEALAVIRLLFQLVPLLEKERPLGEPKVKYVQEGMRNVDVARLLCMSA
jgi:hypothetical protein